MEARTGMAYLACITRVLPYLLGFGSLFCEPGGMAERFKALVSKTSGVFMALVGSNPTPSANTVS